MIDRIRILHISSSRSWGGAEMAAVKLANNFALRGHEVIFAAHPKSRIIKELENTDVDVIPISYIRHFDPITVVKLMKIINDRQIDVIHCHLSRDLVHLYWVTVLSRSLPIILDKQVSSGVSKKGIIHKMIYAKVSKIFVLSTYLANNVLDTCPVTNDKVVVIPGGIRLEDYNIPEGVRGILRSHWQLTSNEIVFGTVSRIDRQKGLEDLVRAFALLCAKYKSIKLVIVGEPTFGEPEYANELTNIIKELGVEDKVILPGFRSDIPRVLSAFDIFVLPSYSESFGYVFIEALSARLPVIATNAGGVPDIIENEVCGLLVPPMDRQSLYDAMERLLTNDALRKQFGSAGRKRVKDNFLESEILDKIEREYLNLIERRV